MEAFVNRFLPQSTRNFIAVVTFILFLHIFFWFQVFIILPNHYPDSAYVYFGHCVFCTYLLFNIIGNFVFIYLTDTTIKGRMLPSELRPNWKFCEVCECITPPRSWHCPSCDICVLKRDHHCFFTGCCVGYHNQRYFLMFLFHLTLATIYTSYFNLIFLWQHMTLSWIGLLKIFFPFAIFVFGLDMSSLQIYFIICGISFIVMLCALALLCYHAQNAIRGIVMYERGNGIKDYEFGSAKYNIKQILGKKWCLTLFWPFVISDLPHDGIDWQRIKMNYTKNK